MNPASETERRGALSTLTRLVSLFALVALGLTAGALLAEARVLVPFWQSVEPDAFLSWYQSNAGLLFAFFAPLEIGAAVLTIAAAVLSAVQRQPGTRLFVIAALLAVAILLAFPLFFKAANASFAEATLKPDEVAPALRTWASWHLGRTLVALVAFVCAGLAFRQGGAAEMKMPSSSSLR